MPIAAVPSYLGGDFREASLGLRFGMYLKLWGIDRRTQELLWKTHDIDYEVRGQQREERQVKYENKVSALSEAKRLNKRDVEAMNALSRRQAALATSLPAGHLLRLDALATAPFTTGLGNEHPLENGFAFLNPYGLPYLPGSGVKGVLRQVARELASGEWGEMHGWEASFPHPGGEGLSVIDALFGKEDPNDAQRGALSFWDVIPQIRGDSLMVEIMTPHQGHYYQPNQPHPAAGSTAPHDSGQPIPISYLTVPPGSGFAFHVVCDLAFLRRIAPGLEEQWKALLEAAFEHAYAWLGFGAKTAVGYGAMRRDRAAESRIQRERDEQEQAKRAAEEERRKAEEREAELARLDPMERSIQEFLDQRPDKNQTEISAVIGAVKKGSWQGDERIAVARWLEKAMREDKQWKESSQKKNPEKDREYQNTLLVRGWLDGK